MARQRIPPLPPIVLIQDRATGTWWQMTHDRDDERWAIRDDAVVWPLHFQVARYEAYGEPWVAQPYPLRFFVRGGRVGVETGGGEGASDRDQAPVSTRRGMEAFSLRLQDGGWQSPGDVIGYRVALTPSGLQ